MTSNGKQSETPHPSLAVRTWILGGYCLVLIAGTHWPAMLTSHQPKFGDKLVHFAAYGVLAWLVAWRWAPSDGRQWKIWVKWAILGLAVFAAVDEWTQPAVGRVADFMDWLADVVGVCCSLALYRKWSQRADGLS